VQFDENLLSPGRLAIIACLVPGAPLSFTELRKASGLADGNLHVQCRKLEETGYIEVSRGHRGRRPLTKFRITEKGLAALKLHVRKLEGIVATESGTIAPNPRPRGRRDESQVWSR